MRMILIFAFTLIASTASANDEVVIAAQSMIQAFGTATTQSINCGNAANIKRIESLKGGVIATYATAGLGENVDMVTDIIDNTVKAEQQRMGTSCDEEGMAIYMRRLESDYKYFTDLMDRKR